MSIVLVTILISNSVSCQINSPFEKLIALPDHVFVSLDRKAATLEQTLIRQQANYLGRLEELEHRLKRKLAKTDPLCAEQSFGDVSRKYSELKSESANGTNILIGYSSRLDSLTTAFEFLRNERLSRLSSNPELDKTLAQYRALQSQLNSSEIIARQLEIRANMLKEKLAKIGMIKKFRKFREQCYYYRAQINAYKESLEDPAMLEGKLLDLVSQIPRFKDFFANNSAFGNLFVLPRTAVPISETFAGLQTRSLISQTIDNRFSSPANLSLVLQQNMRSAQQQIAQLKNRLSSFSSGIYSIGNPDVDIPGFKPNNQKTKPFLKRLEFGIDLQSQKARYFFPVTTDIGLSVGYHLNDQASVGVGASYKIGWGRGWDAISLTHQGVGLRSYVDFRIKKSFYLAGGYEQNYYNILHTVDQMKDHSAWRKTGLIGITKRIDTGPGLKCDIKILWDFLSHRQSPNTQALLLRVGYKIN